MLASISGGDLWSRSMCTNPGVNGTTPQSHAHGAPVSALTDDVITIYVASKQGDLTALEDDGFGPPVTKWSFRPLDAER